MQLLEQISNNDNIKDMTKEGKCSKCGECCGLFIPFTKKELKIIKEYVNKNNIKPMFRYNTAIGSFDARCPFYNSIQHKCNIYEVRPHVCKDFICSRKNWKDKRNEYGLNADYNSIGKPLASFDDLIYNDYEPIIRFILALSIIDSTGKPESNRFLSLLKYFKRDDLLKFLKVTDEDGNEYEGEDIKNCK